MILRNKILSETKIIKFVDFADYKIFENASIQTMIYVIQKTKQNKPYFINYTKILDKNIKTGELVDILNKGKDFNSLSKELPFESFKVIINPVDLQDKTFTFVREDINNILEKIKAKSNFWLSNDDVAQGIVAAPDEYFIIKDINNFSGNEKKYIKKFYTNAGRYYTDDSKNYLFYICEKNFANENIKDYPNINNHFIKFKKQLKEAKIKYKTPNKPYFYLHRERDEKFFINGEKIVAAIKTIIGKFYYTENEFYGSRALNFIKTNRIDLKYLTAILNSKLIILAIQ